MSKGRRKHLTVIRKKRSAAKRKWIAALPAIIHMQTRDEEGHIVDIEARPVKPGTYHVMKWSVRKGDSNA